MRSAYLYVHIHSWTIKRKPMPRKKVTAKITPTDLRFELGHADKRGRARIIAMIRYDGKYQKRSTGVRIPTNLWDKKRDRIKPCDGFDAERDALAAFVERWERFGREAMRLAPMHGKKSVWEMLDAAERSETNAMGVIETYLRENLTRPFKRGLGEAAPRTVKKRNTLLGKLERFQADTGVLLTANHLDRRMRTMLVDWLYGIGNNANTVNKELKQLRAIAHQMHVDGADVHPYVDSHEWYEAAGQPEMFALTRDEMDALAAVEPTSDAMRRVIDGFLMNCWMGLRWGDYSRIKPDGFDAAREFYEYTMEKRGEKPFVIPVYPEADEILERYDWHCPTGDLTNQYFNRVLKEAARLAKLTRTYRYTNTKGGARRVEMRRVCDHISHHDSRRTSATNLARLGAPIDLIQVQHGQAAAKMAERYVQIERRERARQLRDFRMRATGND